MSVPSASGERPARKATDVSKVIEWGRALVDSNRAHKPVPTKFAGDTSSAADSGTAPYHAGPYGGHYSRGSSVAAREAPPPSRGPAEGRAGQGTQSSRASDRIMADEAPTGSAANSRPHSAAPRGNAAQTHDSTPPDAPPPALARHSPIDEVNTRPTYVDARGRGDDRGGETPLSVLSNALDEHDSRIQAPRGASRLPVEFDDRLDLTPSAAPAQPLRGGPVQPLQMPRPVAVTPPNQRPTSPPTPMAAVPVNTRKQRIQAVIELTERVRTLDADEAACGQCVAALTKAAGEGQTAIAAAKTELLNSVRGVPLLEELGEELEGVAAKMATELRDLDVTGSAALVTGGGPKGRLELPDGNSLAALTSVDGCVAASDALKAFAARLALRLNAAGKMSDASVGVLRSALAEAEHDAAVQADVVDQAHDTLAQLVEELESADATLSDLQLTLAARRRRAEELAHERVGSCEHAEALRRQARDAHQEIEHLRASAQRDEASLAAVRHETAELESATKAMSSRCAETLARERSAATEGPGEGAIAELAEADRRLRRAEASAEEVKHQLKTCAGDRDEAVGRAERTAQRLRDARTALEEHEGNLRACKREQDLAKQQLQTLSSGRSQHEAECDETSHQRGVIENDIASLRAKVAAATKKKDAALREASEATDSASVVEAALKRHEEKSARSAAAESRLDDLAMSPPTPKPPVRPTPVPAAQPKHATPPASSRSTSAVEDAPLAVASGVADAVPVALPSAVNARAGSEVGTGLSTKSRRWGRSVSQEHEGGRETPTSTRIVPASDAALSQGPAELLVSPDRAPLHVTMQPRMYRTAASRRDAVPLPHATHGHGPAHPSMVLPDAGPQELLELHSQLAAQQAGPFDATPPLAPRPVAPLHQPQHQQQRSHGSTAAAHQHQHAFDPRGAVPQRSLSRASSVHSTPPEDERHHDAPSGVMSTPSGRRVTAALADDGGSDAGHQDPHAGRRGAGGGGGMAAIEARLQQVLSRRQASQQSSAVGR